MSDIWDEPGRTSTFSTCMSDEPKDFLPVITSDMLRFVSAKPSEYVRFACGSRSMSNIFFPSFARALPRFMVVVVFPVPPFWLTTEMICAPIFLLYGYFNYFFQFLNQDIKAKRRHECPYA